MDGGSLDDLLSQVGPLPEAVIAAIGFQALHGLAYLRQAKRLHRDIKPSNILLNSAGWVRLTDFGVSTELASSLGAAATVTGTVAYMAPERLQRHPYSFPADMWSLGLTLLQCAFGELPFKAASKEPLTYVALTEAIVHGAVPALPAGYSAEMEKFLLLMLAKEPEKRADARVMLAALGLPWFAKHGIKGTSACPQALVCNHEAWRIARALVSSFVYCIFSCRFKVCSQGSDRFQGASSCTGPAAIAVIIGWGASRSRPRCCRRRGLA